MPSEAKQGEAKAGEWQLAWCDPNDCYELIRTDGNGGTDQIDLFVDERVAKQITAALNSHASLLAACKAAQGAMGAHGPCKNNSCRECRKAWDLIRAAIALAEGRA